MAEEMRSPLNVLAACHRLQDDLPGLFGSEAWMSIELEFHDKMVKLQSSTEVREQRILAVGLVALLTKNELTQKRLNAELRLQESLKIDLEQVLVGLRTQLSVDDHTLQASLDTVAFGLCWSLDPDEVSSDENIATRSILIKPGGVGSAKSIKFRNLNLDFGEMSAIVSGALLAGHEVIKDPNGFVIAAGVLMTIGTVIKAATIQIDEQDASVFWGFIQTRDKKDNTATEAAIIASTNRERARYNREALNDNDVRQSLTNLETIKSIIAVEGHLGRWKLIERFTIKP